MLKYQWNRSFKSVQKWDIVRESKNFTAIGISNHVVELPVSLKMIPRKRCHYYWSLKWHSVATRKPHLKEQLMNSFIDQIDLYCNHYLTYQPRMVRWSPRTWPSVKQKWRPARLSEEERRDGARSSAAEVHYRLILPPTLENGQHLHLFD